MTFANQVNAIAEVLESVELLAPQAIAWEDYQVLNAGHDAACVIKLESYSLSRLSYGQDWLLRASYDIECYINYSDPEQAKMTAAILRQQIVDAFIAYKPEFFDFSLVSQQIRGIDGELGSGKWLTEILRVMVEEIVEPRDE